MVVLPAPTMDDLETMDLQDLVNPYDDSDAPDDHRTHIVNPPANQHIWVPGMEAKEIVDIARANGWPVQTLCGYQFVPKRNPENYPACDPCMAIAGELMRGAGE